MTELLTAAQMRAIERAAINSGAVTGLELMERAGRGVVEAVFEEWPELAKTSHRAVVLCGPGNNGGDGFVVARLLKEWGWEVEVFLYGDPEKLPPDAKVNYERWRVIGAVGAVSRDDATSSEPDLIVDALFGTGLARPVSDLGMLFLDLAEEVGNAKYFQVPNCRVTSVDVPSGLCSDSGRRLIPDDYVETSPGPLPAVQSQLTVTFHARKCGHVLEKGPMCCGKVVVVDIGLEGRSRPRVGVKPPPGGAVGGCPAVAPGGIAQLLTSVDLVGLNKRSEDHKYDHGHALILSGGPGRGGAARLAARGALRIGAGLVTVGCPTAALQENAARLDAIMLRPVADAAALADILADDRINALCLGPGLGLSDKSRRLVEAGLKSGRPTLLDADALTLIARDAILFAALHNNCVLTPHTGEFARLFPDIAGKLDAPPTKGPAYSKVDATREAAKRAGCTVLFKGPDTVIAAPDGRCAINSAHYDRAAPWLATAGAGDVLAGFIAGLLARGFAPMQAAETAAWLHVECALKFGPGLIAEDLPEQLPKVFRDLGILTPSR